MGALIHSDKHLVLNNRYALLGCIAVSGAGKVYRGRDLEQVKHLGLESRILIHVLPTTRSWALADMFRHMTTTCQQLDEPWVLKPLAYGHDNDFAYFVLESPDTGDLQSLLSQPDQQQSCYRSTRRRINPLVKQGYLQAHIDPALLVCGKDTLHLLATAFAPQIQALEKHSSHHHVMSRKHLGAVMTGTLLALFTAFAAVASNAVMDLRLVNQTVHPLAPSKAAAVLVIPQDQAIPAQQDKVVVPIPAVPPSAPTPKSIKISKPVKPEKVAPAPAPAFKPASKPEQIVVEAAPEQLTESTAATRHQDQGVDALIQRAYAALNAGNLGENAGALYFTRQLRGQSALHPQVARLGQEITATYLSQVREALLTDLTAANRLLSVTGQLIQEFNLSNLTPAQQVLEDKVAALSQ